MKIDMDQLIRVVAERYRFILNKDDPLMASVLLNEVVFEMHSNMLIQKMDEQNTRLSSALQSTLKASKAEVRSDRELFCANVQAIHRQNLEDYQKIIAEHMIASSRIKEEASNSKNIAAIAMLAALAIAVLSICANVYIVSH